MLDYTDLSAQSASRSANVRLQLTKGPLRNTPGYVSFMLAEYRDIAGSKEAAIGICEGCGVLR